MVRFPTMILPVALALTVASGCVATKAGKTETISQSIKDVLPSSVLSATPKAALATQFATAWQTKLGQLPDPTRNGAMNPGVVGQAFLYTDKLTPAEIVGSLTIVANDATTRPDGMPPRQPNVWHFDAETLKRMVVNDDRFGKSVALFLPWPEDWTDVNRLYIQARYDQPNSYTVYAPPASVTLDFFTTAQHQTSHAQGRVTAGQLSVPDPKMLLQNAKATAPATGPNPVQPAAYAANWPTNIGVPPPAAASAPPTVNKPALPAMGVPAPGMIPPQGGQETKEFQRVVIPR